MYTCDGKVEFSTSITPVFSVTCSFRNHSTVTFDQINVSLLIKSINYLKK